MPSYLLFDDHCKLRHDWKHQLQSDRLFAGDLHNFRQLLEYEWGFPLHEDLDIRLWRVIEATLRASCVLYQQRESARQGEISRQNPYTSQDIDYNMASPGGLAPVPENMTVVSGDAEVGAQFGSYRAPAPGIQQTRDPMQNHDTYTMPSGQQTSFVDRIVASGSIDPALTLQSASHAGQPFDPTLLSPGSATSHPPAHQRIQPNPGSAAPTPASRGTGQRRTSRGGDGGAEPKWNRQGDREGYLKVREIGSCWACFVGKKKCSPEHPGPRNFVHSRYSKNPPRRPPPSAAGEGTGTQ